MQLKPAIIIAAGQDDRQLPLHRLVDRDGKTKTAIQIVVEEAAAGADTVAIVVQSSDEAAYRAAAGSAASSLTLIRQTEPRGYGDVIKRAPAFSAVEPFIRFVGDHLFVSATAGRCVEQLVAAGPS